MKLSIIKMIALIFLMAQAKAAEPSLDGKYKMNLKIGNKTYIDTMEIHGQKGPALLRTYNGDIGGTLTVSNAFTAELSGTANCTMWGGFCDLRFQIIAHERGRSYRVYYQAILPLRNYNDALNKGNPVVLSGSAFLEDGNLFGTFRAIQQ